MSMDYIDKSFNGFEKSNFGLWLTDLFGERIANETLLNYLVGRSKNNNSKACIFWRVDKEINVRTGKIMCYDSLTGKRNKEINPTWVHSKFPEFNYKLCFFGEHLLSEYPDKTIGIVESEKTAIIASIYMPDIVWIATGGNSGCKWREFDVFKVLENRNIILCPDFGYFNKKTGKTCFNEWSERAKVISDRMTCKIQVSRVLEDSINQDERVNDYDLADMLIKRKDGKGWALKEENSYPIFWDIN